jgi:prepilin-type N-terminal cleavage/methylation domain-containing protein
MNRGFTIIEILLVVAIVGLLTGTVSITFGNVRAKSRDQRRKADFLAIQSALELYFAQNKYYPTNCAAALGDGVNSANPPVRTPNDWSAAEKNAMWPNIGQWINHAPIPTGAAGNFCSTVGSPQFTTAYINTVPVDPLNRPPSYIYRYKTNSQYVNLAANNFAGYYEIDGKLELDTAAMVDDGGNCSTRYELFHPGSSGSLLSNCP